MVSNPVGSRTPLCGLRVRIPCPPLDRKVKKSVTSAILVGHNSEKVAMRFDSVQTLISIMSLVNLEL